jgi:hypothetical protein
MEPGPFVKGRAAQVPDARTRFAGSPPWTARNLDGPRFGSARGNRSKSAHGGVFGSASGSAFGTTLTFSGVRPGSTFETQNGTHAVFLAYPPWKSTWNTEDSKRANERTARCIYFAGHGELAGVRMYQIQYPHEA